MGPTIKSTPLPKIRIKEAQAAFLSLHGRPVDGEKMMVEGLIKSRIIYIGREGIIHHHEEDIPFSHLIKAKKTMEWGKKVTIQIDKEGSDIEYAMGSFNPRREKIELTMILHFLLHIQEDDRRRDLVEERILITIPVDLPSTVKKQDTLDGQESQIEQNSTQDSREKPKRKTRKKGDEKKVKKEQLGAMQSISTNRILRELQSLVKKEIRNEITEIIPSLKGEIKDQIEREEFLLEEKRRERIVKKSQEQRQMGYRVKENNCMKQ